MNKSEHISINHFRALTDRAGMNLTDEEIKDLKPVYEQYARQAAALHDLDLGEHGPSLMFQSETDISDQGTEQIT